MNNRFNLLFSNIFKKSSLVVMLLLFSFSNILTVFAVDTKPTEELEQEWELRKSLPVETNLIAEWPTGPSIGAQSAILLEADTGTILYSKNIEDRLYPASITKMMTALLVVENTTMEEIVTFSNAAIDNTEWGSSRIGIMKGEQLTVEQCLYGLLLGSANEVAYGLAEHVGGDLETFVGMMNERAASLGCTGTHFANASGLPDPNHYVTAHDMARIAQAFFENDTLCMISGSYSYKIPGTNKTNEERPMENHHKMVTGKQYGYEGIIGGKTGFTKDARQTLVTCAQKEGMKLICVVMKDESPYQFLDTIELFDYGFSGFTKAKISDFETRYNITSANFFNTNIDIMGTSKPILSLNEFGYAIVPKTMDFSQLDVKVDYENRNKNSVATLNYFVGDNRVGMTTIDYANTKNKSFEFANIITDSASDEPYTYEPEQKTVFVTISEVIKKLFIIVGILFLITVIIALINGFIKSARRAKMKKRKRYKQRSENSRRYNYKKRSENKRAKKSSTDNDNDKNLYTKPIYKDLSARAQAAAETEVYNELFDSDPYYDEDDYDEEVSPAPYRSQLEEQMYNDFPKMKTVELHPLDDPSRWDDL